MTPVPADEREHPPSDVHALGEDAPTVLLVDSDEEGRLALFHMLRRFYCVIGASDAATALALSVQHTPAAIVSDASMLDHQGNRLATLLRLALGKQAPPLIVVGDGADEPQSAAVTLERPVDPMKLISAIESVIEQRHAAERADAG